MRICVIISGMKRIRRRKCLFCGDLYIPNRQNKHHQKYCSKPACRTASKQASQRRWLAKPENRNYHCGQSHCGRVRDWRKGHPCYWRRKAIALQDLLLTQAVDDNALATGLNELSLAPDITLAPLHAVTQALAGEGVADDQELRHGSPGAAGTERYAVPLQEHCLSQEPLFVGLIAMLTDTLQDDIVPVMARLQTLGRAMLGKGPGLDPGGSSDHEHKKTCAVR
jgi:hypothetical protein